MQVKEIQFLPFFAIFTAKTYFFSNMNKIETSYGASFIFKSLFSIIHINLQTVIQQDSFHFKKKVVHGLDLI